MTQNEENIIRLEFTYQYEDVRDARKILAKAQKKKRTVWSGNFLGWVIVLVLAILIFVIFDKRKDDVAMAVDKTWTLGKFVDSYWFYVLIAAILFPVLFWQTTGRRAWKRAGAQQPWAVEMSENGIVIEAATTRTENKWTHYIRMEEGKTVFVLFQDETTGAVLPKRVMSEEQIKHVRKLLQSHVGKAMGFPVVMQNGSKEEHAEA